MAPKTKKQGDPIKKWKCSVTWHTNHNGLSADLSSKAIQTKRRHASCRDSHTYLGTQRCNWLRLIQNKLLILAYLAVQTETSSLRTIHNRGEALTNCINNLALWIHQNRRAYLLTTTSAAPTATSPHEIPVTHAHTIKLPA
jgi:hypothetical protein